ncbi:MAG: DUF1844 domain-containing protein [Thermodesulfobacteriota bacterium]|nr:DUF1844 domain-containing protein [Thermodesulfobacteriota bacterium]
MEEEIEGKGFKFVDKRVSKEESEEVKKGAEFSEKEVQQEQHFPQEVDFVSFIVSFASSAYFHFGDIQNPVTSKVEKDLPSAKQVIDILSLLQEKTKGNLTSHEANVLSDLLYQLRMRYVDEIKAKDT